MVSSDVCKVKLKKKKEREGTKSSFLDNLSGNGVKCKLTGTADEKGEEGNIEG
jgi:hypothetical protein